MDFLNSTLGDWLDHIAQEYPEVDGLVYPDRGLRLSYRQLNEVCRQAAKGFIKLGIKKGDHVAIWGTNLAEWIYTLFACAKIGAVLVTVNTNYKVFELEYLLRQSDSMTLLFTDGVKDARYIDILTELIPDLARTKPGGLSCERVPVLKNLIHLPGKYGTPTPAGAFGWDELMKLGQSVSDETLDQIQRGLDTHEVVNMQYTSGTTGFPKGVMLTHYNILNNGRFIGDNMKLTEKDRYCICVPFFHCFGMVLSIMASITHATTMVPVEYYSPLTVLQTIEAERCTAVNGVPTMFIFMLDHPEFAKFDLKSLRTGIMAGSTCPIQVMRAVVERMNMRDIVSVFGQTECSPGMTMSSIDDPLELRVSTVGRLLPHCEGKVINPETGAQLPPNTPGEIITRGYHIMRGYYNMPEATALAIDADGWLHTGDIGVVDENGYYSITGRLKDMIIRGGENISPREIEELLYHMEGIQDVSVVGIPSQKFGEEVVAWIVRKGTAAITQEDVRSFVSQKMSRHKIPSYVLFTDELPMTASGKIQKFKLRERAVEQLKGGACEGAV